MLIPALTKEEELNEVWQKNIFKPKYKWLRTSGYLDLTKELKTDTWSNIQLISYDDYTNKICGYFNCNVKQPEYFINKIFMINFDDKSTTFLNDIKDLFIKLFMDFNYNKINFSVIIGNPAEKQYDNFIERYNGSIVGIFKKDCFINGSLYDKKQYEIMKDDFIKSIQMS